MGWRRTGSARVDETPSHYWGFFWDGCESTGVPEVLNNPGYQTCMLEDMRRIVRKAGWLQVISLHFDRLYSKQRWNGSVWRSSNLITGTLKLLLNLMLVGLVVLSVSLSEFKT